MKFGDRVNITRKLTKADTGTRRIWRSLEYKHEDCIFLGHRTLREGVVHYDEDAPWFEAKTFKKAALVAVNHLLNPIYVPLDSVETIMTSNFEDLIDALPVHKAGMSIGHNTHKTYSESVGEWITNNDWCDWASDSAKQQSIDTDELWVIQWYPHTSVGFCAVAAPTLAEALQMIEASK